MIKTATVYKTTDGKIFEDPREAGEYERGRMELWMESRLPVIDIRAVLDSLDNDENNEFYGTDRDMAMRFVERAYELSQPK